ncbi:hypothetical protein [Halomonas sp. LBP4]|uniref:hypothetical protein n=1 Tax=Halomonas sp. LBP4 TaxID=2044917 RepID=UPI000D75472F|nr:hypothetical protein [Halomonas sp. LBP4]PXX95950.1 hypothetical protein CR157_17310 [Halomonas sp. LBP4]
MSKPYPKSLVTFNLDACTDNIRQQLEACMLGAPPGALVTPTPAPSRLATQQQAQLEEDRRAMSVLLSQWRDLYRQLQDAEPEEDGALAPIDTLPAALRQRLDELDRATAKGYPLP